CGCKLSFRCEGQPDVHEYTCTNANEMSTQNADKNLNLKWKQHDFLMHIVISDEMVKCKLPGDMVTQTARAARKFFFGAPKTHFDPGKTLHTHTHTHTLSSLAHTTTSS